MVAPPSRGTKSNYQIIAGSLDDLDKLPSLRGFKASLATKDGGTVIGVGRRNDALFRHCMRHARHCDDFEALVDVAATFASRCEQDAIDPLSSDEIMRTAQSAWGYTRARRKLWIGAQHLQFESSDISAFGFVSRPVSFHAAFVLATMTARGGRS